MPTAKKTAPWRARVIALLSIVAACPTDAQSQISVSLPAGVEAVWDFEKADRSATTSRERVCINGLWRWQPADDDRDQVPTGGWGFFKVPGSWPGITDYMQKDCQTVFAHPDWNDKGLAGVSTAWYQRQISVPREWTDRRIVLTADCLNSYAVVYIDGRVAGELRFPGGELDVSRFCRPGSTHWLSLRVVAMPLKAVMLSFRDTASAKKIQGRVARRGLCGDVYLEGMPRGPRLNDLKLNTSVRKWQIGFDVAVESPTADESYRLRARITEGELTVQTFTSEPFSASDLQHGRFAFAHAWRPEKLWDIHTPQNKYGLSLQLIDENDLELDQTYDAAFGFREFWIDGRDFILNGSRIYLSSVPLDNAQVGAAWANYEAAAESMKRLRNFGINFVYTHNYGCEPGSHLGFDEILNAADDVGMLMSFSQPHFSHYEWESPDADATNGYAQHAAYYCQTAQLHPSVVAYSMNHNATGYAEDMNPDMIDGVQAQRSVWSTNNVQRARRVEEIVRSLDPHRIIYHHASGNLGSMHTSNFYANFAPIQEMSDWFEHWATEGVKPLFTCEYSVPMPWDWTMYRGWFKGQREFGSARVPWEFCLAEWNAQFLGDLAYQLGDQEKANLRWEARQFEAGKRWHRWDYPHVVGSNDFPQRDAIYAMYFRQNWPAFRTWGVSANSPWNHGHYWRLRDDVDRQRKRLPVDWDALQQPGFSADYINDRYERMDLAFARSSWTPTEAARALLQYNGPLLAYLAGPPSAFTSQEHNFFPGDVVRKQLILLNNSRQPITCECQWSLRLPAPQEGNRTVTIDTGQQCRIALQFELPDTLPHGSYQLDAVTRFSGAAADSEETPIVQQQDSLTVDVLARPSESHEPGGIALFDPAGETEMLLKSLGIEYELVDAKTDVSPYDMLIVGKQSLTVDGPAPDIRGVRDGLRVLLFEQTPVVLEQRFGFRVATYGLRWLFERVPEHPILNGLASQHLRNWRGEATIVPPRLDYEIDPVFSGVPTVRWCGISSPRLWRCGNRGNVATVLIEKPHRGDFLPILDGGFSLQYSPLMEYREGKGLVVFCQLDVTGRTDQDPAALIITKNLLDYVATWRPRPQHHVAYAGNQQLKAHLESAGIRIRSFADGELSNDDLLAVGRGGWKELAAEKEAVSNWLQAGGQLIAFGLEEEAVDSFFPGQFKLRQQEHIGAFFASATVRSPFCGIGPSDVHNAAPCDLPLLSGDEAIGNGVLGMNADGNVIVCQLTPDRFVYGAEQRNVKRTFRRTSFLVSRLLANMGAASDTPLLDQFSESLKGNTAPSLIRNGAFSSGNSRDELSDHWSFSAQDKQASCKRLKDEGDWLVRLSCPMRESEENATVMLAQAGIPVEAKQWYRISLKARADRWVADQVTVTLMNTSNWRSLFPYQRFVPESSWTTFEFTVQASDTATDKTRFQIWFDGEGTLDLTDVEFVPINDPTSGRWLDGLYLDIPEEWDDPYRFFRW